MGPLDALGAALAVLKPVVDHHYEQEFNSAHDSRMSDLRNAVAETDTHGRALRLADAMARLRRESGSSAVGSVGENISVPLDDLQWLYERASDDIRQTQRASRVEFRQG